MMTAGVVYVLVSMAAALAVPIDALAGNTLLEVVRADLFFIPAAVMLVIFGLIAMVAISNTALVTVVAQSRILFGMARENVVPAIFAKVHPARRSPYVALIFGGAVVASLLIIGAAIRSSQAGIPEDERLDIVDRLATITVVFLLFIYALVIVACLKLRGHDERDDTYRANTPLLVVGILGNVAVLIYTLVDDPGRCSGSAGCSRWGSCSTSRNARSAPRSRTSRPPRASPPPDPRTGRSDPCTSSSPPTDPRHRSRRPASSR